MDMNVQNYTQPIYNTEHSQCSSATGPFLGIVQTAGHCTTYKALHDLEHSNLKYNILLAFEILRGTHFICPTISGGTVQYILLRT